jgi:hypothetical protein
MAEDAAESGSRKAPQKIEKPVGGSTLAGFFLLPYAIWHMAELLQFSIKPLRSLFFGCPRCRIYHSSYFSNFMELLERMVAEYAENYRSKDRSDREAIC